MNILVWLSLILVFLNMLVMLILNIYNFADTIKLDKQRRELDKALDKAMHETLAKIEEANKEITEEE